MSRLENDPLARSFKLRPHSGRPSKIAMGTPQLRTAIMNHLREYPKGASAEEMAQALGGLDVTSVRRRVSELHGEGKIQKTGRTTVTAMGRNESVWEIA